MHLDRSTLAKWLSRVAHELTPVYECLKADLKQSTKLFMEETTAPVLDPGRGKPKTGYLWALARDDRLRDDRPRGDRLRDDRPRDDRLRDDRLRDDRLRDDRPRDDRP